MNVLERTVLGERPINIIPYTTESITDLDSKTEQTENKSIMGTFHLCILPLYSTALLLLTNIPFLYICFINASQYLKEINNDFPAILKMHLVAYIIRQSSHNYSHRFSERQRV